MRIEHGPPGVSGVRTLMHVGADEFEALEGLSAVQVQHLGTAVGLVGLLFGMKELRRVGVAFAAGALAVRILSEG